MSGKILFACSNCFSRHPFEELSSGTQLCKSCRGSASIVKCSYCRSEFQPNNKSQNICKKCEYNLSKYGKPSACECCKIVAAFGGSKCMRCASYEARYGPPVQCDECKLRSAFDRRDENKKVNGKLLCWLCTCAYKRAYLKAQQDGRISSKKRPHEKTHRETTVSSKKLSRNEVNKSNNSNAIVGVSGTNPAGLDMPEKISRSASSGNGNGSIGLGSIAAPAVVSIDPNSADHVVAMTTLKERIASLEKRLTQKDKELLEKDKLLTELKGKNFEKEIEMRNKLKDIDRLNDMKVDNLNRKVTSLLKEVASLKKSNKKNNCGGGIILGTNREKEREKRERENVSPKEEISSANIAIELSDKDEDKNDGKGDLKSDDDSHDSLVISKHIIPEEEVKVDIENREEREKSVKSEKSAKSDNSEANKDEEVVHSRYRSLSGSLSVSPSPTRSKSRSRSRSPSRSVSISHSNSQSRSRSGSHSRSGSRSLSHSRSNSPDSN